MTAPDNSVYCDYCDVCMDVCMQYRHPYTRWYWFLPIDLAIIDMCGDCREQLVKIHIDLRDTYEMHSSP